MARLQGQFNFMPTVMELPDLPIDQVANYMVDANRRYDTSVAAIEEQSDRFAAFETAPGEEFVRNKLSEGFEGNVRGLVDKFEGRYENPEFQRAVAGISRDTIRDERWNIMAKNLEEYHRWRDGASKGLLDFNRWEDHLNKEKEAGEISLFSADQEQERDHWGAAKRLTDTIDPEIFAKATGSKVIYKEVERPDGTKVKLPFFRTYSGTDFHILDNSKAAAHAREYVDSTILPSFLNTAEGQQFLKKKMSRYYSGVVDEEGNPREMSKEEAIEATKQLIYSTFDHSKSSIDDSPLFNNSDLSGDNNTPPPNRGMITTGMGIDENNNLITSGRALGQLLAEHANGNYQIGNRTPKEVKAILDKVREKPGSLSSLSIEDQNVVREAAKIDAEAEDMRFRYNTAMTEVLKKYPEMSNYIKPDNDGNFSFDALNPGNFQADIDHSDVKDVSLIFFDVLNSNNPEFIKETLEEYGIDVSDYTKTKKSTFLNSGIIELNEPVLSPAKVAKFQNMLFNGYDKNNVSEEDVAMYRKMYNDLKQIAAAEKNESYKTAVKEFSNTYKDIAKKDVVHSKNLQFGSYPDAQEYIENIKNSQSADSFGALFNFYLPEGGEIQDISDELKLEFEKEPNKRNINFINAILAGGAFMDKDIRDGGKRDLNEMEFEVSIGGKSYIAKSKDNINAFLQPFLPGGSLRLTALDARSKYAAADIISELGFGSGTPDQVTLTPEYIDALTGPDAALDKIPSYADILMQAHGYENSKIRIIKDEKDQLWAYNKVLAKAGVNGGKGAGYTRINEVHFQSNPGDWAKNFVITLALVQSPEAEKK